MRYSSEFIECTLDCCSKLQIRLITHVVRAHWITAGNTYSSQSGMQKMKLAEAG
jgi:hypothetical protein